MKFLMTAAAVAAVSAAAPAFAQDQSSPTQGLYGTLGYAGTHVNGADLGSVQGRLGYRMHKYFGVEGEVATGVNSDHVNVAPGLQDRVRLDHQEAIYGVMFLPLTDRFDILGRGGYGNTKFQIDQPVGTVNLASSTSWNYGGGLQYHFDGKNGIRGDYTHEEFTRNGAGHANVWSVAYSRRF